MDTRNLTISKTREGLENILDGADWEVNRFIESGGSIYVEIIDKKKL